ncbi:MAG: sulfatase-like hydrolase/transferase [Actinomycetota bacterium]
MARRRTALAVAGALAVAIASGAATPVVGTVAGPRTARSTRPNILLLVSDDQAWSDFSRQLMPSVFSDLVDQGALFKRAYVNTSLCCPSRSQMLTGLYEHDTGVDTNVTPLDRPTIVQALHDQGYRTMLAGKYLNSWPCDPRPEFDRWACVGTPEPSTYSMINPVINEDGTWQHYEGYQTDILATQVADFINSTPADQPFFAMYTPTSPHLPADDPRYRSMPVTPPRPPSFDQNTLTGQSPRYARRGPLSADEISANDDRFARMSHAVRALDDGMGTVLGSLGDRTRDTLVIYLSDNGFLYGEHRRSGKTDAYEESIRVPMIVRYPAVLPTTHAFTSSSLVSNVDITPTIAAVAGIPWHADGRSLLPLLDGSSSAIRSALLIQHCRGANEGAVQCSGLTFFGHQTQVAGYSGVVTARYKYVEYDDGSRQLFDLQRDPYELVNLYGKPGTASILASMQAKLAALQKPVVDTTIVTGPWPAGSGPSDVVAFTFFSPSRFSTYRCRLVRDGVADPWHACDGQSDEIGGLPDGSYTFEVAGQDEFGAVDPTPATRSFTIRSSGPPVSIDAHPPAAQRGGDLAFAFSSSMAGASFECRLVPQEGPVPDWSPCSGTTSYHGLAEGRWSFDVRALDPATQAVSRPPAAWVVDVDRTGPSFVVAQGPRNPTSSRVASFRFVPTEGVPGTVTCRLDGGPGIDCSQGVFTTSALTKGSHTLRISASDTLSNPGGTDVTWVVDLGPPLVKILGHPHRFTSTADARFRLSSKTDPALFLCSLDGMPEMPCDENADLGALPDGRHVLTVWGLDAALNRSHPLTYRWLVDTIPPGLALSGTPDEGAVTADRTTALDVFQSEPGPLLCSLDGAAYVRCASPVVYTDLADGPHTLQMYAQDRAGNVSITVTRDWTIDPNAP